MTDLGSAPRREAPAKAAAPPRSRRLWLPAALGIVALAGVGSWTAWRSGDRAGAAALPTWQAEAASAAAREAAARQAVAGEAAPAALPIAPAAPVTPFAPTTAASPAGMAPAPAPPPVGAAADGHNGRRATAGSQAPAKEGAASAEKAGDKAAQQRAAQVSGHRQGTCIEGYVWREARPGDKVCVTPIQRATVARANATAATRVEPAGGAYGPETCKLGYVWREAYPGDKVCVVPQARQQAAADNAAAASRVVPLPQ